MFVDPQVFPGKTTRKGQADARDGFPWSWAAPPLWLCRVQSPSWLLSWAGIECLQLFQVHSASYRWIYLSGACDEKGCREDLSHALEAFFLLSWGLTFGYLLLTQISATGLNFSSENGIFLFYHIVRLQIFRTFMLCFPYKTECL
eukprot:NP_001229504.1 uncharacterized protein LOC100130451 [Homo sapiens]